MENNKYQKALEGLRNVVLDSSSDGYHDPRTVGDFYNTDIELLQELVDKETPKQPIKRHYEDEGEMIYIIGCPAGCKVQVSSFSKRCPICGQRIKWED